MLSVPSARKQMYTQAKIQLLGSLGGHKENCVGDENLYLW